MWTTRQIDQSVYASQFILYALCLEGHDQSVLELIIVLMKIVVLNPHWTSMESLRTRTLRSHAVRTKDFLLAYIYTLNALNITTDYATAFSCRDGPHYKWEGKHVYDDR
ncbi:hypothetical protein EVAR_30671_1 [Eumeta japonica]|uniref:Uncharacterized protein n=1 Tax=Eumeta variegata TaxID=151549 RepID=A0A4C1VRB8_EUMVA|nr:hypothetical protein EVAR_30671_1 [Eumeta japonica]